MYTSIAKSSFRIHYYCSKIFLVKQKAHPEFRGRIPRFTVGLIKRVNCYIRLKRYHSWNKIRLILAVSTFDTILFLCLQYFKLIKLCFYSIFVCSHFYMTGMCMILTYVTKIVATLLTPNIIYNNATGPYTILISCEV